MSHLNKLDTLLLKTHKVLLVLSYKSLTYVDPKQGFLNSLKGWRDFPTNFYLVVRTCTGLEITVSHWTLTNDDAILFNGTFLSSHTMTDGKIFAKFMYEILQ